MTALSKATFLFTLFLLVSFGRAGAAGANYVRFDTNLGSFDVELLPTDAPHTVANFLAYVNSGAYTDSIIHRSVPGFVIQGGGFSLQDGQIGPISTYSPIVNEYKAPNVRGTLAMAKGTDPNSATSEWYFNEVDNSSSLDTADGGYTVFGHVVNNAGLAIMDAIAAVPVPNPSPFSSPLDQIPLINYVAADGVQDSNLVLVTDIVPESAPTAPTITSITPVTGPVGSTVVVKGTNFAGPLSITIGGVSASGNYNSTTVSATVPAGATSGPVIISTANGSVISTTNFTIGSATPAKATVTLGNLKTVYDGSSQAVTVTTSPASLPVSITYNGSNTAPTDPGSYTVVATVTDADYTGTATGTLVISPNTAAATVISPDSIAGVAVTAKITSGEAPFATAGSFRFITSASDGTYGVVGLSGNVGTSYGAYTYTKTGTSTGEIDYTDQNSVSSTVSLTFTTPTSGSYQLSSASAPNATQAGTFTINSGQGPESIAGWTFQLSIAAGTSPFATKGTAKITTGTSGNTYQITGESGVANSTGTYTYSLISESASSAIMTDSNLGTVYTHTLCWTSPTAGAYIVYDDSGDFQGGTFTATPATESVTSALTASGTVGVSFSYQVASSGGVTTYGATGLPAGLSIDSSSGLISGSPSVAGTFKVALTTTNGSTAKATLVLTVAKATVPVTLASLTGTYTGKAQPATASTNPPGLTVDLTYNGKTTVPVNAGSYSVVGIISDPDYTGTASSTLTINPAAATVTLGNLAATYTGKGIAATATTVPAKLPVSFTYGGSATEPVNVGHYSVTGSITNPNYIGSNTGTLVISPVAPLATTEAATAIGANTATLEASINPKGDATTVQFQYGLSSTSYGAPTGTQTLPAGTANVTASLAISGLSPQTIYHYRVVASNGVDAPVDGADKTFTTLAQPVFGAATAYLAASGAQVSQGVTPNGVATSVYFQYGTTTGYGSQTAPQSIGSGKTAVSVYALLPGLESGTLYYYREVTVSAAGTFYGPQETFTTLGFDTTLVIATGTATPGIPNATFSSFGNPAVVQSDGVAFGAVVTGTGVTTANNLAIFADTATGTLGLVAQTGQAAAGTGTTTGTATFASIGDPLYDMADSNEVVAFGGALKVATGLATQSTELGVWSYSGGTLSLVARQGAPAPGVSGATFGTFDALGLSDAGTVILATLNTNSNAGVTSATNFGIWEGATSSDLALQLRTGQTVGSKTIGSLTLLSSETLVSGQTRNFASNTGDLAVGATFTDKTTGIVEVIGGTATSPVLQGDTAPGIGGATFSAFSSPIINTHDRIAFEATVTGGVTTADNAGIWAKNSTGTLQLVAQTGTTDAPGTTATFATLSDPVYNDNEKVAFGATLKVATGQATSATASGIWSNVTGTLTLVAQQGVQAPGCPAGATFAKFTALALADESGSGANNGGLTFLGTLNASSTAAVTTANNTGIWAVDSTGTLQLIVRTGDILPVNGVNKTVTALAFLPASTVTDGQTRSFAPQNGDLTYLATFSDKSTAIFNVVW